MPGKKRGRKKRSTRKSQTRTFRIRRSSKHGDAVEVQLSIQFKRVPKGLRITKKLLESMIRRKAQSSNGYWDAHGGRVVGAVEGDDPPGMRLLIKRWKNPSRKKGSDRAWRSGSQAAAWGSLRWIIETAPIRFS